MTDGNDLWGSQPPVPETVRDGVSFRGDFDAITDEDVWALRNIAASANWPNQIKSIAIRDQDYATITCWTSGTVRLISVSRTTSGWDVIDTQAGIE